jgi:hypothetical protein
MNSAAIGRLHSPSRVSSTPDSTIQNAEKWRFCPIFFAPVPLFSRAEKKFKFFLDFY